MGIRGDLRIAGDALTAVLHEINRPARRTPTYELGDAEFDIGIDGLPCTSIAPALLLLLKRDVLRLGSTKAQISSHCRRRTLRFRTLAMMVRGASAAHVFDQLQHHASQRPVMRTMELMLFPSTRAATTWTRFAVLRRFNSFSPASIITNCGASMTDVSKAIGGHARASALTSEQRSEIAKKGALARWGSTDGLQRAEYTGELKIGDMSFPCSVLSDGTRILTQSDFMTGMGLYYSGWVARNRTPEEDSADVPHFLSLS